MALNGLYCADVLLSNYSLTHSLAQRRTFWDCWRKVFLKLDARRRRRFRIDTEVCCVGAHPPFDPLSRQRLNPIKPVYDPDGRLNLTASAFNQLGQYTSSPGRRGYCYAELAVFFPSGDRNHRQ